MSSFSLAGSIFSRVALTRGVLWRIGGEAEASRRVTDKAAAYGEQCTKRNGGSRNGLRNVSQVGELYHFRLDRGGEK